jgi:D-alanine-D-alanine ligase
VEAVTERRVRIIFNDDGSDKYVLDGKEFKLGNMDDTVKQVEDALRGEGFATSRVPLKTVDANTLDDFVREIREDDGGIAFNLCEAAFGKSYFEMHVAALLELYGVRFTGSGPLTLGLALNKGLTKGILSSRDILTPEYSVLNEPPSKLRRGMKFPLIVKPLKEDASIGIDSGAVVNTMRGLKKRVEFIISNFNQPAIVEEYVDGREFNISILGNGGAVRALPPSEIDFVDFPEGTPKICCYEAKWVKASPLYKKTKPICPANVADALRDELSAVALRAYETMGCRDYARVDMRVGEDGNVKVLEVNPNPDISADAGFARAARTFGLDYGKLIAEIVRVASDRYAAEGKSVKAGF